MPPSKLDKYLNILEVLIEQPQKAEIIGRRAHLESSAVRRCMGFLVSNGVVEKRGHSGRVAVYALTERGVAVFKKLRAMKYFEKLRDSFSIVEEASEITSLLSQRTRDWKKQE